MDAAQQAREEEKKRLLNRLAELMIEEQVEEGNPDTLFPASQLAAKR